MSQTHDRTHPYFQIIQELSQETFADVFASATRQVRQAIVKILGVKKKSSIGFTSIRKERAERAAQVYSAIKLLDDDELAEQLLRNWLLQKRSMLCTALDWMKIPHVNGTTEEDLDGFQELSKSKAKELFELLAKDAPREQVYAYLRYLDVPSPPLP